LILEVALLDVKKGQEDNFESKFHEAQKIISSMHGYVSHQLQKCIENPSRYILLVNWQTLEDHTEGFRLSEPYKKWKALLHDFYEPFPTVEHFECVEQNGSIE